MPENQSSTSPIIIAAIMNISTIILLYVVSFFREKKQKQKDRLKKLEEKLDYLMSLAIQYPLFENEAFTKNWNGQTDLSNDNMLRYDVYSLMIFNYWANLAEYCNYDLEKINTIVALEPWVKIHKKCWRKPIIPNDNEETYDPKFVNLMNNILEKTDK